MKHRSLLVLFAVVVTCFGSLGCKSKTRTRTVYVETHKTTPAAVLRLLSPNGGETWLIGSSQTVSWTPANPSSPVDIEYTTDGTSWTALAGSTSNDGSQLVTVPADPSSSVRIRVSESAGGVSDSSDGTLSFVASAAPPALLLLGPNGGESWLIGSTQSVIWMPGDPSSPVDIEYTTDGLAFSPLAMGTANDGSQIVTVPGTPSSTARIRVTETATGTNDGSDANLTFAGILVTTPNGGEVWTYTLPATVTWVAAGVTGPMDLHYSMDGATWIPLVLGTPNDGTQGVTVPDEDGSTVRVRVTDSGGALSDSSDADFTIRPQFQDIGAGLLGVEGDLEWGDYDADGDLDLAVSGSVTKVYRNDGGGVFTDLAVTIPSSYQGDLAWGDYDNDGDLDLAVTGWDIFGVGGHFTAIYRNDGGGTFTDIVAGLAGLENGVLAWGDYDNDGDLDLVATGINAMGSARICTLYRNLGGDTFSDSGATLPGVQIGSIAWGDYDRDGDLDLAIAGYSDAYGYICRVYRNDGAVVFTDIAAGLPGVYPASLAWGDYDGDGDLDLALAGSGSGWIYRNDGGGIFSDIGAGLTGSFDSVAWSDYDNDGDLDLSITGSGTASSRIARNDGGGIFTPISDGLPWVLSLSYRSAISWGDFDGDGDLDAALAGYDASSGTTKTVICRNNTNAPNAGPGVPSALTATPGATAVLLSWVAPIDDHTAASGLGYNLRIGSTPGGSNGFCSMADAATGYRRIPRFGPAQITSASFTSLGIWYWSVQAIDSGLRGGGWATEGTFTLNGIRVTNPNGGEVWLPGSPATVTWDSQGVAGTVDIEYTVDGVTWLPLAMGTANDGTQTLVVPDADSTTARVRVSESAGGYSDNSDSDFKIHRWQESGIPLTGLEYCSVAWGDYDSDGDLDLAICGFNGASTSRIYRNDGGGLFTDIGATIGAAHAGSLAWGDYDNDGDLDLAIAGHNGIDFHTRIYRNDGGDVFTEVSAALSGFYFCSLAWGDYDNDGDLDLAIAGYNGSGPGSRIYRNDGGGAFTDIGAALPGFYYCSLAWGDYDNDGDLDLAISGYGGSGPDARIYRNDGGGAFIDIGAALTGVYYSSLAWGDYDNDGDLDLVIAGYNGAWLTKIYRNDGVGIFTDILAPIAGASSSAVVWGDYDHDGDLDFALAGGSDIAYVAAIYRNDGGGIFTDILAPLTGVTWCSLAWGDYDGDGDLDLALAGEALGGGAILKIYDNHSASADAPPLAPALVSAIPGAGSVTLTWTAPADDVTPSAGLGYNLRIGTSPGGSDLIAPMADLASGYRRVVRIGSVRGTSLTLAPFPGTYYWSVQAVDSGLNGGAWAAEGTFGIPGIRVTSPNGGERWTPDSSATVTWMSAGFAGTVDIEYTIDGTTWSPLAMSTPNDGTETIVVPSLNSATTRVRVSESAGGYSDVSDTYLYIQTWVESGVTLPGAYLASTAWGDDDNDGDLDLALAAYGPGGAISRIYRNDGSGAFTDSGVPLIGLGTSALAWGDYDNDGDLDLAISGMTPFLSVYCIIYRNDSGGVFTDIGASLSAANSGSLAWGDFDNDGDLDLAVAGGGSTKIYRNEGGDVFTDIGAPLTGVGSCSIAWGDFDNDGDLDLALAGYASGGRVAVIYRNDGGGAFADSGAALVGVNVCSLAWGDYDNDGDLDLTLAGDTGGVFVSKVYRNDGGGTFTDIAAVLVGIQYGSLAWGDFDNDGDLDLALAGESSGGRVSRIYRNDGGDTFTDIGALLTDVGNCSLAWGDYNGDGKLDLVLAGEIAGGGAVTKIYDNHSAPADAPPAAPTLLSAIPSASSIALAWTAPADDLTPAAGLNYNLRIGTSPSGSDVLSPMADVGTGARLVPRMGSIQGTAVTISLPSGTYYWSVQAVDTGLMGGAWATEGSFTIP